MRLFRNKSEDGTPSDKEKPNVNFEKSITKNRKSSKNGTRAGDVGWDASQHYLSSIILTTRLLSS